MVEQLGVMALLDAAVGPIKARARGLGAGPLLVGMAAAELAGQDHHAAASALAHLPSGSFSANAAWAVLWAIAHNLTRAAGA
ncbi:MAG: hypothetical protein ACRDTJ_14545, partial [Pseudonocardiaceae bacterium]